MSEWKEAIRERLEGHLPKQDANAITDMLADLFRPEDSIRRGQADAWSRVWGHICSTGLDKRFGPHENGINIALAVVDLAAGAASRPAPDVDAIAREAANEVQRIIIARYRGDTSAIRLPDDAAAAIIREAIEKGRGG
jgi:hypothetical protein